MSTSRVGQFVESSPSVDNYWRAIILFGRNVASYKFALGRSLLELADQGSDTVSLEELAIPFSRHLTEHLAAVDTQGTSAQSRFLTACRAFNTGDLTHDQLIDKTAQLGFVNVIDAFHVVGPGEMPVRFFIDERGTDGGIRLTDDLLALRDDYQYRNLRAEVEARWRLVETSWHLGIPSRAVEVTHDSGLLVVDSGPSRTTLTGCRDALNGYQKGHCFYCSRPIQVTASDTGDPVHVDHLIPFRLGHEPDFEAINLDGVWNLVLACSSCNLAKHDYVPQPRFAEALETRNNYLISSHHPLRETLRTQTGQTVDERRSYLQGVWQSARNIRIATWEPDEQIEEQRL